jgi:dGTPase
LSIDQRLKAKRVFPAKTGASGPELGGALAPYAADARQSRGRLVPEPSSPTRSPFARDRDRILHATAFRRLNYKTQVFIYHEGDHYRSRLTHSLEVAQIARSMARRLRLDEDLTEALALAHDLGHPPFGHAGERALDAAMTSAGGFDHNAQSLRVVTELERKYASFDGLNLTWEMLEGLVKHNGPLLGTKATQPVPEPILAYSAKHDLELATFASVEAQVASLADDIAYNNHDIDDGLHAGLFAIADLAEVPLVGPVFEEVARRYPGLEESRLIHESIRRLIDRMVRDLIDETRRRLAESSVDSADAIRNLGRPIAAFSEAMGNHDRALKRFLHQRMYRHQRVNRMSSKARRVVRELFQLFLAEPQRLPGEWRALTGGGEAERARIVADYLAGMTDRFALDEHRRLVDT